MAGTFRSNGHTNANGSNVVANLPPGLNVGDFMVMAVCVGENSATVTTPTGWTSADGTVTGGLLAGQRLNSFYKIAVSGETAPTVAVSVSSHFTVDIMAFAGCRAFLGDAGAHGAWTGIGSSTSYVFPSVTLSFTGDVVILMAICALTAAQPVTSAPAGFSQIVTSTDGVTVAFTAVAGIVPASGATGTFSVTYTSLMGAAGLTAGIPSASTSPATVKATPPGQVVSSIVQARNAERKEQKNKVETPASRHHRVSDYYERRRRA